MLRNARPPGGGTSPRGGPRRYAEAAFHELTDHDAARPALPAAG